jgi:hypothetical protein
MIILRECRIQGIKLLIFDPQYNIPAIADRE